MNNKTSDGQAAAPRKAGLYKRIFASMMANSSKEFNELVADRKRTLLGQLHGTVLEIGPGTGPNLAFYPAGIHWIGVEPNTAMYPYLEQEAQRLRLKIDIRQNESERLPADYASVDAVVSTLVLCSVREPTTSLREILRVLKPGGRFVFIEHVAAPRESRLRFVQRLIRPAWKVFSDGCHTDRETWTTIENAGFSTVQLEHYRLALPIIGTQIAGTAVK